MKKEKRRNLKKKIKLFGGIVLAGILCILSFMLGKKIGADEAERVQVLANEEISVKEQILANEELIVNEEFIIYEPMTVSGQEIGYRQEAKGHDIQKDILLVNKDNQLPKDYKVTLKTLPDGVNKAAEEAYQPLCDMLRAGRKEGLNFEICSSYRDVERQRELFDEDMKKLIRTGYSYSEAYEEVARETMPPGHSEHSTGLAFDIVSLGYQMLDAGQEKTAESKWLREHCAEYGFILRYPKGKEDITKINYESWHFRYVGVEVATYIMENEMTLEEYLKLSEK